MPLRDPCRCLHDTTRARGEEAAVEADRSIAAECLRRALTPRLHGFGTNHGKMGGGPALLGRNPVRRLHRVRTRLRPQCRCAQHDEAEPGQQGDGLENTEQAARARQAGNDLGQWNPSLGDAPG
jgi:hypothetical protein